jgi:hypothetical protein
MAVLVVLLMVAFVAVGGLLEISKGNMSGGLLDVTVAVFTMFGLKNAASQNNATDVSLTIPEPTAANDNSSNITQKHSDLYRVDHKN